MRISTSAVLGAVAGVTTGGATLVLANRGINIAKGSSAAAGGLAATGKQIAKKMGTSTGTKVLTEQIKSSESKAGKDEFSDFVSGS